MGQNGHVQRDYRGRKDKDIGVVLLPVYYNEEPLTETRVMDARKDTRDQSSRVTLERLRARRRCTRHT